MAEENEEAGKPYPYHVTRVYVNAATAGLAILLMFALVNEPLPLLSFVAAASLLAVFRFFVKVRFFFKMVKLSELQQGDVRKSLMERSRPTRLLGMVAIAVSLPLLIFMTRVLPISIWLTVTASVASGFGLSEVFFYVYCRRQSSGVS